MAAERNTQFNYLLNAMERAAAAKNPASEGYGEKRHALMAHVRDLERKAAAFDAGGAAPRDELRPMDTAPRNGTEVLLAVSMRAGIPGKFLVGHYMEGGYCIEDHPAIDQGWYFWNGCMFDKASEPIGWLPLPADGVGGLDDGK